MKLWTIVTNGTQTDVNCYIDDLLDALVDVQIDNAHRTDRGWATLIQFDVRLCQRERELPLRVTASDGGITYSGWLRELRTGTIHSSIRSDVLTLDPTQTPVVGEFSCATIDVDRVVLMTDHYATHPVYYWHGRQGHWVASNDLRLLLLCRLVPIAIRRESCIELLTQSVMVGENELAGGMTFFRDVFKMPANSTMSIDRHGRMLTLPRAKDLECHRLDDKIVHSEDFVCEFRTRFDACVKDRLEAGAGGIMLSGGVDSNSVLGACLAACPGDVPFCTNMSFKSTDLALAHDDKLVEALVRSCGVPHRIIYADDFLRLPMLDDPDAYVDGPDVAANPLAKEACARVLQDRGVSLVMTGEGGDVVLGESMHRWIHDAIRRHKGIRALHDYVTENLAARSFSPAYFGAMLTSLPTISGRRRLRKEFSNKTPDLPDYLGESLRRTSQRHAHLLDGLPRTTYLGHDYIRAMLFPRATYFDTLNVHCTQAHPFLDPRMVAFALACPPHLHHDFKHLDRNNPYATSKMLARNAYREVLPKFATEKASKTSYGLMARKMFQNSAKALIQLSGQPMILNDWGLVDQVRFRRHLIAYIVATEDPNAELGTRYHYIRGVIDLETWLAKFSGSRHEVVKRLKFAPLRALAG